MLADSIRYSGTLPCGYAPGSCLGWPPTVYRFGSRVLPLRGAGVVGGDWGDVSGEVNKAERAAHLGARPTPKQRTSESSVGKSIQRIMLPDFASKTCSGP